MNRLFRSFLFLSLCLLLAMLSACAVTTRAVEGSSETFENTTEASTKLSSSTSPSDEDRDDKKSDSDEHGKDIAAAIRFSGEHFEQIRRDAANGQGEYLRTIGSLLGVADQHQAEFGTFVQRRYEILFDEGSEDAEKFVRRLDDTLDGSPKFR